MPTNHVDKLIEAYVDNWLSTEQRQHLENHVKQCPDCARRLFDAQRLSKELRPVLHSALGQPSPAPILRQKVKAKLHEQAASRSFYGNWAGPAKLINGIGTVAVVGLMAYGLFFVIQAQTLRDQSETTTAQLTAGVFRDSSPATNPGATLTLPPTATLVATPVRSSLSDTLPSATVQSNLMADTIPMAVDHTRFFTLPSPQKQPSLMAKTPLSATEAPPLPGGTLAFALYQHDSYHLHFISPNGSNHRQFPQVGVSEPALHPTDHQANIAYRSWSEPSGPRALVSSNWSGDSPNTLTDFWEDAQPDWSPTENRLIFASRRESDRRWRLYSVWGDGSLEVNLRREGKAPSFAPDGYRFAFESCDAAGEHCGLWLGDLDHSELESKPFLEEPLAASPDWSPVSEDIVYMANPGGNWDLYVTDSAGQNVRQLTDDSAADGLPVWSPDGEWLAFVSDRDGQWGLWLLHLASGHLHQTIHFDEGSLTPPSRPPYDQPVPHQWLDEQLSWAPQ